jgi:hypothetical protein
MYLKDKKPNSMFSKIKRLLTEYNHVVVSFKYYIYQLTMGKIFREEGFILLDKALN